MKLFELAKEINVQTKDLVVLMKQWGMEASGTFQVLDEKTIKKIKTQLAKSSRPLAQKAPPATATATTQDEDTAQPKPRRRLISIRSSGEVRRLDEQPEKPETKEAPDTENNLETPPAESSPATPLAESSTLPETDQLKTTPAAANVPTHDKLKVDTGTAPPQKKEEVALEDEPSRRREKRGDRNQKGNQKQPEWRDIRGNARDLDLLQNEGWVRPRRTKQALKRKAAGTTEEKHVFKPRQKAIKLDDTITVSKLATLIGIKGAQIIKKLMELDITATMNDLIDGSTAELVASEYGVKVEIESSNLDELMAIEDIPTEQLETRPPIITIMGHVDHGKTTLLDQIRASNIVAGESGGITQHIGAYRVDSDFGPMVFLDTPGHEAFTSLRQRGANITDIVALLVAADDGIMPQTIEAIQHAQAAEAPIVVVVNKIDRPNADIEKIKQQLLQYKLVVEELGGDTMLVSISAKTGKGIKNLLESIYLQAELLDLKSTPKGPCSGVVIESYVERTQGVVGSVLVQRGQLNIGDYFVAGSCSGRVRAMYNDKGKRISSALPSTPVKLFGYNKMPEAGDAFQTMSSESNASQLAQFRNNRKRATSLLPSSHISLETFMEGPIAKDEVRTLKLVLKADTQGSLETIISSLEKEGNEQISVQLVRSGVGGITQTDVALATVSNAVIIGFHVRPDLRATTIARADGMEIKIYHVIYELINDIHLALEGMLKPVIKEQIVGRCLVREVFAKSKDSLIAGGSVEEGKLERNAKLRLYSNDVLQGEVVLVSLRRHKEDVTSVRHGTECGFRLKGYNEIKPGDVLEAYVQIEEKAILKRGGKLLKKEPPKASIETPLETPLEKSLDAPDTTSEEVTA